jgi:lysozyme
MNSALLVGALGLVGFAAWRAMSAAQAAIPPAAGPTPPTPTPPAGGVPGGAPAAPDPWGQGSVGPWTTAPWAQPWATSSTGRFPPRALNTSSAGVQFIRDNEKLRLSKYPDGGGYSIGYGHHIQPGETFPATISTARAEQLLQADIAAAESAIDASVSAPLSQGEFDALVDFVFNEGAGTFSGSSILSALNAGNYTAARAAFAHYTTSQGKQVSALVTRRKAEQSMWGMS